MIDHLNLKRQCRPMAGLAYFGGDSSAATTNSTEQYDMRVVGGADSQNISANNSSVSIVATDHDAVTGGLNTANKAFALATQLVSDNAKQSAASSSAMFQGALGAVSSARQDVAAAYQNATTPENGMLKIAGFVVVGIAAVGLIAAKVK